MSVTVNGVSVEIQSSPSPEVAAIRELLRQRSVEIGLLKANATNHQRIDDAIELLLAKEVEVPEPTEKECKRHYETHLKDFQSGDIVHARHILFQVMAGAPVVAIRARAEQALNELLAEPNRFDALARELSNCPSGQQGGNLGQISRGDTVPEFEKALFRLDAVGILPDIVKTRFGLHIVSVDKSIPGNIVPFEAVREQIAERLKAAVEEHALRQYVSILAGQAEITGAQIEAVDSPLVQ